MSNALFHCDSHCVLLICYQLSVCIRLFRLWTDTVTSLCVHLVNCAVHFGKILWLKYKGITLLTLLCFAVDTFNGLLTSLWNTAAGYMGQLAHSQDWIGQACKNRRMSLWMQSNMDFSGSSGEGGSVDLLFRSTSIQ